MKLLLILLPLFVYAQNFKSLDAIRAPKDLENVHIVKLSTDKNATNFIVFVKRAVKPHVHKLHSETIFVLEGEASMRVGEVVKNIKAGDFIFIPENTIHSVEVLSKTPLKVLSIQAPEFFGKDRVFIEKD